MHSLTRNSAVLYFLHHPCFILLLAWPLIQVDIGARRARVYHYAILKRVRKKTGVTSEDDINHTWSVRHQAD